MPLCFKIMLEKEVCVMKKHTSTKKKKIDKLEIVFVPPTKECSHEEGIKQLAELCYLMLEIDRDHHRKKLQESEQYCFYCKKQITELNDFYSPDGENCCFECAKKLTDDPNRQERFCGFPVVSSKDGSPVTKSSK